MNKVEFNVLNQAYNKRLGRKPVSIDEDLNQAMKDEKTINELMESGLIGADGIITDAGIEKLNPYKVDNAIILAAGPATRFIPLSLEKPKGLYEVKGKRLIERQIEQLQEAGINKITIVLGYKKEMFFYLKEKYQVEFLFNDSFNIKNNIESLYIAKDLLKNTYICSCDDYFMENPFNQYEFQNFYAGKYVNKKMTEMYVDLDHNQKIDRMEPGKSGGYILLGHTFWNKEFSKKFIAFMEDDREVGLYNDSFWEWLVMDKLTELPDYYFKKYDDHSIFEFDYFEQLRKFDEEYIGHTHSEIIRNIKLVFRCDEEDIIDFRNVSEGMTNTSFIFKLDGEDYIYRHPGDGTEKIINRKNEKTSLQKAKEIGVDPTYIYLDVNDGWKISKFIHSFREPDYNDFEDSKRILKVLRQLHASTVKVDYGMKPWEDALEMEHLLIKKDPDCFKEFVGLKEQIRQLYEMTEKDSVEKCFCHGDTYKPNWMIKDDGSVILIDWEYSGYSDPGIDVGYYIVDAMYDVDTAKKFVKEYLADQDTEERMFHFMSYVAIIAYYWFVWALYRESCGAVMGEALYNWYEMAKKYANYMLNDLK